MSNLAKIDQVTNLHRNNELQLLCFRLEKDKDLYAVNVFKIREVVKYRGNITVVSHESSSLVEGLITIRELTIPLIDMRKWFHYDSRMKEKNLKEYAIKREEGEDDIIMICEFSRWTVGVRIYEADRILNKKWTEIEQSAGIGGATQNSKLVSRTRYFDGSLVQVVDIEKMLVDVFPWIESEKEEEMRQIRELRTTKEVLLADDSPSVLKTMQNILDRIGVEHKDFVNGQKLLNYIFDPKTDVEKIGMIITDLEMPEASGFEVIKQLKANSTTAHLPIVVNSSMSGSSNEEMARSLNADEFISKSNPIEIEEVMRRHLA
ncbi:chemotaxis protein [Wolinella succinogenes]|jgi:two-component system chemotaxis response regulator CheV|uniref:PUTATIVE CHEMOTAXIS PROTEIN n=1 Tax=Wolinella succinogenes (strain ATCC 29543 / DSM 1740 / CCUG 13145 / JCM 31913 / LMG 7466 / NCTC 11488 / FDC 602W) TaxID=273121 RepID=Q7MAG8_WOLSU|nr:chemotaxis protein [Wolinella succinogenes]NLU34536.1 chemotaxis protein CheV [Wolinella succinogenes]CAE09412.1 PUTATIVE CHEMOTAXIS PROTEIN [Wolinella succinogenes]VEG81625.1 Chemotaxis protein CheV [Wolinella succinogenes]HCZ18936.1 chemotaxis protein CheV [Helicobacter sp.]